YHFASRTTEPLAIIGPPGVEEVVRQVMAMAYPDVALLGWPRPVHFTEVREGEVQTVDGLTFSAVPVPHLPAPQQAFGYRLHLEDGILAYSGDTEMSETLFALVDQAAAVILEASAQEVSTIHLGRQALREILHYLPAKCPVFLNHLDTPDATAWQDMPVIVPDDLQSYLIDFSAKDMPEVTVHAPSNAQDLESRLQHRERQLHAVFDVTQAMQSHLDLDELVRHALLKAMETVDADAGSLLLHDAEQQKLVFRHVEGPSKEKITGLSIADTQGIAGEVFHGGQARISLDVNADRAHIQDVDQQSSYQTRSMVTVPLEAGTGDRVGVLQVLNKRTGDFTEDDLEVLEVLATQVASAIITAQLFQKAQAAAIVDMLGHISHDIKNLLTPVSMAGQTLRFMLDDFNTELTERLSQPTQDAAELAPAIESMLRRVTEDVGEIFNILDESTQVAQQRAKEIADTVKGMTAPPAYELVDVNEVVRGVTRVLRFVAEQQGVTLDEEFGEVPQSFLDSRRMYNAIYNLVNNAIGATPRDGCVTVSTLGCAAGKFPDGHFVQVCVQDTGCGMPPEIAAHLFTGHVRSTKAGGTGLGARVVKNVIEAHGGLLRVESVQGQGTAITAVLPLRTGQ
ncbi:MAG TPA: ATP-binding protein, partial [Armatimonadota bacterium]